MMSQSKISQGLSKVEPWNIIDSAQIITDEKEINPSATCYILFDGL